MTGKGHLDFEKKAFYTPAQVARLLEVHPSTVREWIASGRLFAFRIADRVTRIPLGSLMSLLGEATEVIDREIGGQEAVAIWERVSSEHEAEVPLEPEWSGGGEAT